MASSHCRSISPPPIRRQIQQFKTKSSISAKSGTLRIFAWNVNGVSPFVTPYLQGRSRKDQRSIRSFFRAEPQGLATSGKRKREDTENGYQSTDSDDGPREARRTDRAPSLRKALERLGWPHILCLQEVKIKRGDILTMDAVRAAVNDISTDLTPTVDSTRRPLSAGSKGETKTGGEEDIETLRDGGSAYDVHFNLPGDPHNAKGFGGKIYGVATVVQRSFARKHIETVRDVSWDKEGRVQIIETRCLTFPIHTSEFKPSTSPSSKQSPTSEVIPGLSTSEKGDDSDAVKFAIINIYAVNGTSNPYRSSEGSVIGTRHDRKLAVHFELLREARCLEDRGFAVVIAGDLNVARDARDGYPSLRTWPPQHFVNRGDFNEKFFSGGLVSLDSGAERTLIAERSKGRTSRREEGNVELVGLNGIDTFRSVHGDERRYSYYPRGRDWGSSCDRVDLIIASRALGRFLVDAGIRDNPRDRGPSDHCPVWAEFGRKLES